MTFLRLLSREAHQNFTFTCINSVAWYNSNNRKFDLALKLKSDDNHEFSYSSLKSFVIADGCRNRKSKSETIFDVRTEKLKRLPIVDFYPSDYGMPHQAFGFSVGPVCFK